MKISLAVDYGLHASSLTLITQKIFRELSKIVNTQKSFTVTATLCSNAGIGDVNQHYDCISIPNMGGYNFPPEATLSTNHLFVGVVGIDEVVLGKEVFRHKKDWIRNKPIIEKQVNKWKNHVEKINRIHVSTNSDKDQVMNYLDVPEEKIDIIPYGVDHDLFKPSNNRKKTSELVNFKFFLKKDHPYFLHVGEKNWARKNTLRVFEAFKKARSSGISQNLLVIGRFEELIHKKAKEIPGIVMCGYVTEELMIQVIQGADALILPSLHEGFGLPLVESMACGVPVITSNVFSPPEIVKNAGLFVDPYNVTDIYEKIIEFVNSNKIQDELSQNAIKRSQDFSWTYTATELLKLFQMHVENPHDIDFDTDYSLSAYRTLTTISQIHPDLIKTAAQDLLEFDYSRIIEWSLEVGINDPFVKDYIIPLKQWLEENRD